MRGCSNLFIFITLLLGGSSCSKSPTEDEDNLPSIETPAALAEVSVIESPNYNFGFVEAGSFSETILNLTNTGSGTATSINPVINPPYKYKGGTYPGLGGSCLSSLTSGSTCQLALIFQPTSSGTFQLPLIINYLNGLSASQATIDLSGTGLLSAPDQLSISSSAGFTANKCYPLVIKSTTNSEIESAVTSPQIINLIVNNGTGQFYNSSTCLTAVTSTTVNTGQSSSTVYFKSLNSPQDLTLIASTNGLSSAQKSVTVSSNASKLNLNSDSQIKIGSCAKVVVSRLDANGYAVYDDTSILVNISSDAQVTTFSDSSCATPSTSLTLTSYDSSGHFYIKNSTVSGSANINVSDSLASLTSANLSINFVTQLTWWNTDWPYRVKVNLNNLDQNTTLTNQAVLLKIDSTKINYSAMKPDGTDLRFINFDDSTELSYEIEKWDPVGTSYVWVKVPLIHANSNADYIYLYFGHTSATDSQNKNDVWTNYNTVWHFSDNLTASAPQILDSTSSNRHGTIQNSPTSSTGVLGSGLNLNGNFDSFDAGNLAPILGISTTMSFWMKTSQVGNNTNWLAPGITGIEQAGGANDIFFGWITAGGYLGITAGDSPAALSNFIVNNNAWRHITTTRNSITGICTFYVNGVLNGTSNCGAGTITTPFNLIGVIGDTGGTPTEFDGELDEIRIFSSVKTTEEIKADFKFQTDNSTTFKSIESSP